jgi:gamma-glutamylcyclotransferase (GGCT)/AIG2-like uncharacterized protein YtfP
MSQTEYTPPEGWVTVHRFDNGDVVLNEVGGELDRGPQTHLVFAFGDLVDRRATERQFWGSKCLGKAVLTRHRLLFTGALGTASVEPDEGRDVHGLVWEVPAGSLAHLDYKEGAPSRKKVAVARVRVAGETEDRTVRYYVHKAGVGGAELPTLYDFKCLLGHYVREGLPLEQLEEALYLCA